MEVQKFQLMHPVVFLYCLLSPSITQHK
jgi:hypothetical protein